MLMKTRGHWMFEAVLARCRERAGTLRSQREGPSGLTLPCSAASSTPWQRSWPFPPISQGLLPWEFASAISWNKNLFIFKGEQT